MTLGVSDGSQISRDLATGLGGGLDYRACCVAAGMLASTQILMPQRTLRMPIKEMITPFFLNEPRPVIGEGWSEEPALNAVTIVTGPVTDAIAPVHLAIADFVAEGASQSDVAISIAGDCCASIPVLAGLQRAGRNPVLVWLDSHGDFNTWETSPSGFLGGMPLAMIAGRGEMSLMENVGAVAIPECDIYLCDARDLDPKEAEALTNSDVTVCSGLDMLLERLPDGADVYVHFDSDIIDSGEVPAQSYPVAGGPGAGEVEAFFAALAHKTNIVAASMSAWNPELDVEGRSGRIVRHCFQALLRRIG